MGEIKKGEEDLASRNAVISRYLINLYIFFLMEFIFQVPTFYYKNKLIRIVQIKFKFHSLSVT